MSKDMQTGSMDDDLRNSLWNEIYLCYFKHNLHSENTRNLFEKICMDFLKKVINEYSAGLRCTPYSQNHDFHVIRKLFSEFRWYNAYNFIEFLIKCKMGNTSTFKKRCNMVLEREFAGYKIINNIITPITNKNEMEEVSKSLNTPFREINTHFEHALSCLSAKPKSDPRNSIKESISAVEAICKKISNNENDTLGAALTKIESKLSLHSDMIEAFRKLYGYTNDASGIRHSLMNGKNSADFDDAKFMLVSCSAFVNYIIVKSHNAGIRLK